MKLQIVLAVLFAFAVCAESQYIDNSYIVQLKDGSTEAHIEEVIRKIEDHTMTSREEMEITSCSSALPLVFGKFGKETAEMVSRLESVELVEQDQIITLDMPYESPEEISIDDDEYEDVDDTDSDELDYSDVDESEYSDSQETIEEMEGCNSTDLGFPARYRYNLDIIDNRHCRDNMYNPRSFGNGVDIYILDSGIRYNHNDFRTLNGRGNRAFYGGYDVDPRNQGWDHYGHGTHCAGIAGGRYSGVARGARLFSIRVFKGRSGGPLSGIMKGMDHAFKEHLKNVGRRGFRGSVMSMSLTGGYQWGENNLANSIVRRGVTLVTASGNDRRNACYYSPGSAGLNINVGGHGYIARDCRKPMYYYSNYGNCVHIVAPGVQVLSADYRNTYRYTKKTGTSMACPHVSGVAALMLQLRDYSPAYIKYKIQRCSINDLSNRLDSTHRLYVSSCLWS